MKRVSREDPNNTAKLEFDTAESNANVETTPPKVAVALAPPPKKKKRQISVCEHSNEKNMQVSCEIAEPEFSACRHGRTGNYQFSKHSNEKNMQVSCEIAEPEFSA